MKRIGLLLFIVFSMQVFVYAQTTCPPITTLPYIETFEDYRANIYDHDFPVNCWKRYSLDTNWLSPGIYNPSYITGVDNFCLAWYWDENYTIPFYCAMLPHIDSTLHPINTLELSFWAFGEMDFAIGVITDDEQISTINYYDTVNVHDNYGRFTKYTVYFDNYNGPQGRIVIMPLAGYLSYSAYMDNVKVDVINRCPSVNTFFTTAGSGSARIDWTVDSNTYHAAQGYHVRILERYSRTLVDTLYTTHPWVLIDDLDTNTDYITLVGTVCNDSSATRWDSTIFHTQQILFNIDGNIRVIPGQPLVYTDSTWSDSISIYWSKAFHETQWELAYLEDNHTEWVIVDTIDLGPQKYTFTNLTSGTLYYLQVTPLNVSHCRGANIAATTACGDYPLPIVEDFEDFINTDSKPCWTRTSFFLSDFRHSGRYSVGFQQLITPSSSDLPINQQMLSFWGYTSTADTYFVIGVSDSTEYNNVAIIDTLYFDRNQEWRLFTLAPIDYTGTGNRFVIISSFNDNRVDDLRIDSIPECPPPFNIHIDNVGTHTAHLSWQVYNTYSVEIDFWPDYDTSNINTWGVYTDSVILTGLQPATRYSVRMRSHCSGGDTSEWSQTFFFTTDCQPITSLPYIENFRRWSVNHDMPACWGSNWTLPNITVESRQPIITETSTDTMVSHPALRLMNEHYHQDTYVSLPQTDSSSISISNTELYLHGWRKELSDNHNYPLLVVGVSVTDDGSLFTPVDTLLLDTVPRLYEISFDNVLPSAGKYVTLLVKSRNNNYYHEIYIDSIALTNIPICARPIHITASNISPNSADIAWHDRSEAPEWQIEYGHRGFALGSGTRITVTSNPYQLTGLSHATYYDCYIRSICSETDTSEWSLDYCTFTTLQFPAPTPYHYDFEDSTEWHNWQACSYQADWCRGTFPDYDGNHSIYISTDHGITSSVPLQGPANAAIYRDIDFGNSDSTWLLSFRSKVVDNMNITAQGLVVYIVDRDQYITAVTRDDETPWGPISSMDPLIEPVNNVGWYTFTADLDTIHGIHRIAFFWYDTRIYSYGTIYTGKPIAVDDIDISHEGCHRPFNLSLTDVTTNTADIEWFGPSDADYEVTYRAFVNGHTYLDTVHTNRIHFTNLAAGTRYIMSVRKLCGSAVSNPSIDYPFGTLVCDDDRTDTIANPSSTTTSKNIPFSTNASYSYSQQIFESSEVGDAGAIHAISFRCPSSFNLVNRSNCAIYLGHTNKDHFNNQYDCIDPGELELVYLGAIQYVSGWTTIMLDSPFEYDGSSNLVVAIDDNYGTSSSYRITFAVDQTPDYKSICYHCSLFDSENPMPFSLEQLQEFSGTKTAYTLRNQMVFQFCQNQPCGQPRLLAPIVRADRVRLRWRNEHADHYTVSYRLRSSNSWTDFDAPVYDTTFVIRNLLPEAEYVYRLQKFCTDGTVSNYTFGTFATRIQSDCLPLENPRVDRVTNHKAYLSWDPDQNNIAYDLHVFNSWFDTITHCALAHDSVNGLEIGLTYYAAVRAYCINHDQPCEWSDTIAFTTQTCPDVSNVTYSNLEGNSVTLDWECDSNVSLWEIQYGVPGFSQGSGLSRIADHHPFELRGLTGESSYELYVRSICDHDWYSELWSNPIYFTTPYSSINAPEASPLFAITPNPAHSKVAIDISSPIHGNSRILIRDATGREIRQIPIPQTHFTLDLSDLASGVYFVTLVTTQGSSVQKLIIE